MFKKIRLYSFVILLLTVSFIVVTDIQPNKKNSIANDNTNIQESIFISWWHLLLEFPLLSNYLNPPPETFYEPRFSKTSPFKVKTYVIGIHPLHNPKHLFEIYAPIVDFINVRIPEAKFTLEASRDYKDFERKIYNGHFDFAMPNPYQTIKALKYGYRVFGKMADDEDFRGIILVRRDSGIQKVSDLKGKAVSYPAATALAATMMPQYYLQTHGLNINVDIENRYVGSQESSIMNVLRGYVAAGATWPVPWKIFSKESPDLAKQLEVKWQTESLQNNGWIVRNDVPMAMTTKVAATLFSMNQDTLGKTLLARVPVSRFEAANNETYQPVQIFLEKFSKTVRPVE